MGLEVKQQLGASKQSKWGQGPIGPCYKSTKNRSQAVEHLLQVGEILEHCDAISSNRSGQTGSHTFILGPNPQINMGKKSRGGPFWE